MPYEMGEEEERHKPIIDYLQAYSSLDFCYSSQTRRSQFVYPRSVQPQSAARDEASTLPRLGG
jgi:hypothetical protein